MRNFFCRKVFIKMKIIKNVLKICFFKIDKCIYVIGLKF